jgi:hypothetical protein
VPESRKARLVDGYTALKAAQRAAEHERDASTPVSKEHPEPESSEAKPETKKPGAHIGRTVLPTKYEVTCYECGFTFEQTGRSQNTQCLKCRTMLDFIDYTIDSEWTDSLRTAGKIRITPNGVIQSGELIGGEVFLEGKVEADAHVHAHQWMNLGASASFKEGSVSWQDLRVPEEASFNFRKQIDCRHVEVAGKLKAKLKISGLAHVKATGCLEGSLDGARLAVDEGGGLKIKARIEEAEEEAEPLKKTA